jgi:hypothetical protein
MINETADVDNFNRYYIINKKKIIKQFNSLVKAAKKVVSPVYGKYNVDLIAQQA